MKIKIILFAIVAIVLGLSLSTYIFAEHEQQKTIDTLVANKISAMTNIDDVESEGNKMIGSYIRKIAELKGEISLNTSRITSEEVVKMIENDMTYSEIENRLEELYNFPDFRGGSGIERFEYWIDDQGNERILLLHQSKSIFHIIDDGKVSSMTNLKAKK